MSKMYKLYLQEHFPEEYLTCMFKMAWHSWLWSQMQMLQRFIQFIIWTPLWKTK
jgi:hypothetical protein